MSFSFYLFLFFAVILAGLIIAVIIQRRKNGRSELYNEGVHHENTATITWRYHNYADALNEMKRDMIRRNGSKSYLIDPTGRSSNFLTNDLVLLAVF